MFGTPIVLNETLEDGALYWCHPPGRPAYIIIGTHPRTEIQRARWHARWLVQQGLIDVLDWLGEKPIPKHPLSGKEVLARFKQRSGGRTDGCR